MTTSLWQAARACLDAQEPEHKLELTGATVEDWCNGYLSMATDPAPGPDCHAGLPERLQLVHPRQLPRRGLGSDRGRAALLHAIAHIEYNAINLAWDAVYRFRGLPLRYYSDWVQVAGEEALHYRLLTEHLATLDCRYGDLPAHNGLWQMARDTAHDPLVRMALIPRVLEARGLDVTPGMIERFERAGDHAAAAILKRILADEIGHVAIGTRWFNYLCELRKQDPTKTFRQLLQDHLDGRVSGPINRPARRSAGFGEAELDYLEQRALA